MKRIVTTNNSLTTRRLKGAGRAITLATLCWLGLESGGSQRLAALANTPAETRQNREVVLDRLLNGAGSKPGMTEEIAEPSADPGDALQGSPEASDAPTADVGAEVEDAAEESEVAEEEAQSETVIEDSTTEDSTTEEAAVEDADPEEESAEIEGVDSEAAIALTQAATLAQQAEQLTQRARSAADWDAVMVQWLEAIALTQSIPPESPSRIVAQRQMRGYLQRLLDVQQRTEQASPTSGLPSLGSDVLDAQLAGYLSYVATVGTPDVLIVGSSRALQGIDPQVMQQSLAGRGYDGLTVFNFSVNGATAQVVNFVVSELLPEPLPAVIVWGDGSRAFNDGRRDRTWESLIDSPGYQAINTSESNANTSEALATASNASRKQRVVTATSPLADTTRLNALGFSAVGDRFVPQTYYQQFPQVNGRYDGAYSPFQLYGPQTDALATLANYSRLQNSRLIFVNLPLSSSYLDDYRLYYESQFQDFLKVQGDVLGFDVVDMLTQWRSQPALFADPSHINQAGAAVIATQLAQNDKVLSALQQQNSSNLPSNPR